MKIPLLITTMLFGLIAPLSASAAEYAVAIRPTPVLNSPDFKAVFGGKDGQTLKTDRCGQVRELEYIAMTGSLFKILKPHHTETADIYQIETDEYTAPPNVHLYVDGRFLKLERNAPPSRMRSLPQKETIVSKLRQSVGSHYVWGGNVLEGLPEVKSWFYANIKDYDVERLTLAGLDCSGLLYRATDGWTPRNTSQLIKFGRGVAVEGKQAKEIAELLQPLDLLVWNGHVIIVLDPQTTIESRLECGKPGNGGVVTVSLPKRIAQIMRTRRPVNTWTAGMKPNDIFFVRRWYPQRGEAAGE